MQIARKILLCDRINHSNVMRPYSDFPKVSFPVPLIFLKKMEFCE